MYTGITYVGLRSYKVFVISVSHLWYLRLKKYAHNPCIFFIDKKINWHGIFTFDYFFIVLRCTSMLQSDTFLLRFFHPEALRHS